MKPSHNATSMVKGDDGFHSWSSPLPYLFGGLAFILGLIAIALTILAFSYTESSRSSSNDNNDNDNDIEKKPTSKPVNILQPEMEPRIVVIMAGDDNPTYLAKPVSAIRHYNDDKV